MEEEREGGKKGARTRKKRDVKGSAGKGKKGKGREEKRKRLMISKRASITMKAWKGVP